jgi:predicted dehydrogenase
VFIVLSFRSEDSFPRIKLNNTSLIVYSSWWFDETLGGGMLGAIGSHLFDLSSWFLHDSISELSARLETLIKERPTAANDCEYTPFIFHSLVLSSLSLFISLSYSFRNISILLCFFHYSISFEFLSFFI